MENKKTAVDWLFLMLNNPNFSQAFAEKIYDKAKEMEKEQIIDAYVDGIDHGYTDLDIEFGIQDSDRQNHGEDYYNENYK